MNNRGLGALLWKDYRLNRLVLIAGLAVLLIPFLAAAALSQTGKHTSLRELVAALSPLNAMVSMLVIAALGANTMTAEKTDRSAAFMAYLPPSRLLLLLSKAICVLGMSASLVGVNLALVTAFSPHPSGAWGLGTILWRALPVAGLVLGGAWLTGALLSSTAIATCAGVLLYFVVVILPKEWFPVDALVLGASCLLAGAAVFVRREAEV